MMTTQQPYWRLFLTQNLFCLLALGSLAGCSDPAESGADAVDAPMMSHQASAVAGLHLLNARVNSPVPGQPVSAGYFTLMNHGLEAVTLVGVESELASVEMHTTRTEPAGTSMRPLAEVIIEPDQQTVFRPGGHHLMLRDIATEALAAKSLAVTFRFADGSRLPGALAIVPMDEWMQNSAGDHSMH